MNAGKYAFGMMLAADTIVWIVIYIVGTTIKYD